jgi:hypothetical protein
MGMTNLTAILATVAIAWLPASCSKNSTAKVAPRPVAGTASSAATSTAAAKEPQGPAELLLTNNSETFLQLGNGKVCRIKPELLDEKNLKLTLALETKKGGGDLQSLIITQVVTPPGQPFEIVMSTTDINFTPVIVQ